MAATMEQAKELAVRARELASATRTVTAPSNLPGKPAERPDLVRALQQAQHETNEARGVARTVVALARTKKLSAREEAGFKAVYGWLEVKE